ncbi:bacteriocin [Nostoc sp. T09]|uniref:bacteriocin n=1 Tax=Nostoc sp. T09 TaxID=1932621 RepID=UPI0015C4F480|nr:bacteriocin [Nostoc sp. T09]
MQNNKNLQPINKISLTQYEELSELELETVSGGKGSSNSNRSREESNPRRSGAGAFVMGIRG